MITINILQTFCLGEGFRPKKKKILSLGAVELGNQQSLASSPETETGRAKSDGFDYMFHNKS
jgi:hypothetical protein